MLITIFLQEYSTNFRDLRRLDVRISQEDNGGCY